MSGRITPSACNAKADGQMSAPVFNLLPAEGFDVPEPVTGNTSGRPGIVPARLRANIGLAVGLVFGLILALAEVTVAVPLESHEGQGPRYGVVIVGIVVFRYPQDGELYKMRPGAQVRAARVEVVCAATLVSAVLGWIAGYAYGSLTGRSTRGCA